MDEHENDVPWGATRHNTDTHISFRALFHNYCDAFRVKREDGTYGYLDPTCNMIRSDTQCRESAFFKANKVEHTYDKTSVGMTSMITAFGSGSYPPCLCIGEPHNYVKNFIGDSSFIHDFLGENNESGCGEVDINQTFCSIDIDADEVHIENSTLTSQCGFPQVTQAKPSLPKLVEGDPDDSDEESGGSGTSGGTSGDATVGGGTSGDATVGGGTSGDASGDAVSGTSGDAASARAKKRNSLKTKVRYTGLGVASIASAIGTAILTGGIAI